MSSENNEKTDDSSNPNELDEGGFNQVPDSEQIKSDFAFKLVNAVKSMNLGEISYHELASVFITSEELKCLYLFVKALPYSPITPIYPETPFLFFKGVPMPRAFDMSEETAISL